MSCTFTVTAAVVTFPYVVSTNVFGNVTNLIAFALNAQRRTVAECGGIGYVLSMSMC